MLFRSAYFGRVEDEAFARLATRAFELFRCPLLEIAIERAGDADWQIAAIKPLDPRDVPPGHDRLFQDALEGFTHRLWRRPRGGQAARQRSAAARICGWKPGSTIAPPRRCSAARASP